MIKVWTKTDGPGGQQAQFWTEMASVQTLSQAVDIAKRTAVEYLMEQYGHSLTRGRAIPEAVEDAMRELEQYPIAVSFDPMGPLWVLSTVGVSVVLTPVVD